MKPLIPATSVDASLSVSLGADQAPVLWPERVWLDGEAALRCLDLLFEADSAANKKAHACLSVLLTREQPWPDVLRDGELHPRFQPVAHCTSLRSPLTASVSAQGLAGAREAANSDDLVTLPAADPEGVWSGLAHACGQLLVLRRSSPGGAPGRFAVFVRREEVWHLCDARGETAARLSARALAQGAGAAGAGEGVVLRLPEASQAEVQASAWRHVRWIMRRAWAEVGLASLWINLAQLALPLYSMLVYDKVVNNGTFETLWALTLGLMIFVGLDTGLRLVRSWSVERLTSAQAERDDQQLWERLVQAGDPPPNALPRLMATYRELAATRDFVSSTYLLAIADLPFLVLYLLAVALVAWPLALVATALVGVYAWAGHRLHRRASRLSKESEQVMTGKLARLGSMASCLDLLRTAPAIGVLRRRWLTVSTNAADAESRRRLAQGHATVLSNLMVPLSSAAMLIAGCYLIEARWMSVGGLIAANLLASRAMGLVTSAFMVMNKWADFQRASERLKAALPALDAVPSAESGDHRVAKPTATGRIDVIGLSKQFDGRPDALRKVSFTVQPGERIAILGQPAAGKSTLLRALAGLVESDHGKVMFDGAALGEIPREQRVTWLSFKSQDPQLFAGTLADDLRVGAGSRSHDKALKRALWASGLDQELSSGRLTLGTLIEDGGRNLSGGQRQKIALARALSRKSAVVLLDEPSLGLDPETERRLVQRLPEVLQGATLIMVTHSGTMLSLAERVLVLDGGKLVADGVPNEGKLVRRVA